MIEITFTDAALGDVRKIGPDAAPKVLKEILLLLGSPTAGYPLGGDLTGFRKLVVGRNTWRIVYRVADEKTVEICEIWAIGARADAEVHAEAAARVKNAASGRPELRELADVIETLGHLSGHRATPLAQPREPVPDWLAQRLIRTVGMAPQDVAALSLREAVDRWGEYMSRPDEKDRT
ncbi:MAG TPA: type II toxin-antitoxin system RelE/ParE family toxin [Actinocrinis sp.]|nr:type II toxin-antitoxin system RelE/ParE family toxin [Actinocrinis sp.]